ncbi:C6 zinc finger domain protein [Colletotrichum tofieldiae]|uniref:C6 zinc finger domain protein n=1 Tax=Colletotrichum tofieldiae TaxID=708197 RepID=A0A166SCR8_9PEZI|nr:C6 zinc finger domain protein [Colletotrichum tofieldiae]
MDFFNQFTDMNTPGSIDFQGASSIEPIFPLSDVFIDGENSTPSAASETTSSLQPSGTNTNGLWPDIIPHDAGATTDIVKRFTPSALSSSSRYEAPLSPSLQDNSSILVEYYFKEVCGMMSCYDSKLNPYRTTISNLWSSSPSLYYVTQSMAAACLSEVSPGLVTASGRLRDQAISSLWNESKVGPTDTSSLLALVMLGFSLCWHDPGRLGQSEFELLAETVAHLENQNRNSTAVEKQKRFFFYNSLVYWKMLLSFVTDQELPSLGTTGLVQPQPALSSTQQNVMMPHPQSGIGVEVLELVAQVGALVRKERRRIHRRQHSSRHDIKQSMIAIRSAEQLHAKLCQIQLPREVAVVDSGDDMTPTDHLLKAAEAYRCTGLLQLYRNFPDLLSHGTLPVNIASPSIWLEMPEDADRNHFEGSRVILDTWLTSLALHVLDLVLEIPISSRSRSIQPFLLVSICSELSLGRTFASMSFMKECSVASIGPSPRIGTSPAITDILHGRRLIISRLSSFEGILAAKPIRQMLKLVKETWACMDNQQEDVYWIDVMMERGYETLMG